MKISKYPIASLPLQPSGTLAGVQSPGTANAKTVQVQNQQIANYALTYLGSYSVVGFGATLNGVTNDTAAILTTIAAVAALPSGGVVFIPPGTPLVTAGLISVTSSNVIIVGAGTQLTTVITAGTTGAVIAYTGTSGSYLEHSGIQNLSIGRSGAPGIGSNSHGLEMTYCNFALVQNIKSYNSVYQFYFTDVITSTVQNCYAFRTLTYQGAGDLYCGFRLISTGTLGNQSTKFINCTSVASVTDGVPFAGTGYGFWVDGTAPHDVIFENCEGDGSTYGILLDGSANSGTLNWSIKLVGFTADTFVTAGIAILNMTISDLISIIGGDTNSAATGATNAGISLTNVQGCAISTVELLGSNVGFDQGIYATNCQNINATGCEFKFVAYPIYCDNTGGVITSSSFCNNTIYTDAPTGSGGHTVVAAITVKGATLSNFNGNTIKSRDAAGIASALVFSNSPSGLNIKNNTITATVTTPISVTGSMSNVNVRDNIGLNPISVISPAVPLTTVAQTNTFLADCWVYVSGAVTGVTINGVSLGISGTLVGQAFLVPAWQTIALTYSGSTPTWVWIGT